MVASDATKPELSDAMDTMMEEVRHNMIHFQTYVVHEDLPT